eukprot:g10851.t1 g10851   contig4:2700672-2704491(-)
MRMTSHTTNNDSSDGSSSSVEPSALPDEHHQDDAVHRPQAESVGAATGETDLLKEDDADADNGVRMMSIATMTSDTSHHEEQQQQRHHHSTYAAALMNGGLQQLERRQQQLSLTREVSVYTKTNDGCDADTSNNASQCQHNNNNNNRNSVMSIQSERAMSIASERANTPGALSVMDEDFIEEGSRSSSISGNHHGEMVAAVGGGGVGGSGGGDVDNNNTTTTALAAVNNNNNSNATNLTIDTTSLHSSTQAAAATTTTTTAATAGGASGIEATLAAHAQQQHHQQYNQNSNFYYVTPRNGNATAASTLSGQRLSTLSKELLRSPEHTLERLSYILGRGRLVMINFSQRNLGYRDAELIRSAILSNPQLAVLKLSYNNLGNLGANLIASAIKCGGGVREDANEVSGVGVTEPQQQQQQQHHHPSLSVLDLGFNNVGDSGCSSLASLAVARNPALSTLYLSGNAVRERGSLALAEAIAGGCGLTALHLTANRIGPNGVKALMRSMAEFDVTLQMAQQDRENRLALEEENKKQRKMMQANEENGQDGDGSAISDSVDVSNNADSEPDDLARLDGFKCMEELYLGGTNMESPGCLSVSNMLLTNMSLRILCLSDNGLNDQDLSLFSQSLSRNRQLPLETLRLSFNKLTCVGIETLMNAIWGSKTLREIKLDNNQIRDRGAQLAAVVLTSVELEVLDIGFNRLTIVGIKALMKSLAENCSLLTLTLSGNVLDTNASKAVSYALAYNKTIRKLYVDHCSLSYAAQRHIAAGIVSNSNLALRVMSGFPLGAISVTLGLPSAMENWTNEQVLKFIRVMWDRNRHEKESELSLAKESMQSMSSAGASEVSLNTASEQSTEKPSEKKVGPSDPATVVAAAKSAFATLGDSAGALLLTEEPQREISDTSPMVSSDAVMLEKTPSGTLRVPPLDDDSDDDYSQMHKQDTPLEVCVAHRSTDSLCTANGKDCPETPVDPVAKKRNMDWLRFHFRSLNEMTQLPYTYADLLQLYRYFYSAVDADEEGSVHSATHISIVTNQSGSMPSTILTGSQLASSPLRSPADKPKSGMQRKASYRGLHDMMMGQGNNMLASSNYSSIENSCRRRPVSAVEGCNQSMQPALKRARNDKPRIDYFPRIKAKIEHFLSSSSQSKALVLLRQLKFVETTMFRGSNPYCDQSSIASPTEPVAVDAEIILIDML